MKEKLSQIENYVFLLTGNKTYSINKHDEIMNTIDKIKSLLNSLENQNWFNGQIQHLDSDIKSLRDFPKGKPDNKQFNELLKEVLISVRLCISNYRSGQRMSNV